MGIEDEELVGGGHHPQVDVPSHFKCPISLCLMADPVSVCTGITYDRSSIQKWFQDGRRTCPVTMQELHSQELIPNRTLHSIIQSWCLANRLDENKIDRYLDLDHHRQEQQRQQKQQRQRQRHQWMDLREAQALVSLLRVPASRSEAVEQLIDRMDDRGKKLLIKAGLGPVLVAIFARQQVEEEEDLQAQVLCLLSSLVATLDESSRKILLYPSSLASIARHIQRGDLSTRIAAAAMVEELGCSDRGARTAIGSTPGIFEGLVRLVGEDQTDKKRRPAVRASLRAVLAVCPPLKNRARLVETGVVAQLAELLVEADKVTTEAILAAMECLCGCAEGRAAVARHALAVPVVAKKLFKVSDMATEYAIDVLWAVCKYCPDEVVKRRMVEVGLFPKLFFFLQIGCNPRTKHKAGDLLKLLHRAYRECVDGDGGDRNKHERNKNDDNNNNNNNTCLLTAAA